MKTIELENTNKRNCFRGSRAIRYSASCLFVFKTDLVAARWQKFVAADRAVLPTSTFRRTGTLARLLSETTRRREFCRRHRQCQRVKATYRSCNYSSSLLGRVESVTGSSRTRPTLSLRAILGRSRVHSRGTSIDERWTTRTIAQHQPLPDSNRPGRTTLNQTNDFQPFSRHT